MLTHISWRWHQTSHITPLETGHLLQKLRPKLAVIHHLTVTILPTPHHDTLPFCWTYMSRPASVTADPAGVLGFMYKLRVRS